MTDCISRDRLVDLLPALGQPAAKTLDHLASCTACRAEIASLDRVRELIGAEEPLPAGFVDHVMHRLEESSTPDLAVNAADLPVSTHEKTPRLSLRGPVRPAFSTVLVALLSGVAACVVLVASVTPPGPGVGLTPLSLFMGVVAGAGLTAYDLARSRDEPRTATEIPQQRT
jgi:hypothetical protein